MNGQAICGVTTQWNIIQPEKGLKYWYILQHGQTSKTSREVKDVSQKRPHVVFPFI